MSTASVKFGATLTMLLMAACSEPTSVSGTSRGPLKPASGTDNSQNQVVNPDSTTTDTTTTTSANGNSPTLDQVIQQCGVTQDQLNNPDAVLFDKTLHSWPTVITGSKTVLIMTVNYRVTITVVQSIHSTTSKTLQQTDFQVTADPPSALPVAKQQVAPNIGSETEINLTTDQRVQLLGSNPDWNGIICTVQPVAELDIDKGGYQRKIKFDPPLPASVSPKADPARYQTEIGQGKVFNNITATVLQSNDPNLPVGTTMTGQVQVVPVSPTLTLNISGTQQQSMTADMAYQLNWNFGSGKTDTMRLGLMPSQTMYISNQQRDFSAVVANTGNDQLGTIVLTGQ